MTEDSRVKMERNRVEVKKSEEKEKRCSTEEISCCSMWCNVKTVGEGHVPSENVPTFCCSMIMIK